MDIDIERAVKIAKLNDEFRRDNYETILTPGIRALDNKFDLHQVLVLVRKFDKFTEDNDPHKEHDFGSIDWNGLKIFWKIDYYDLALKYWCDPLSKKCQRVMTVMLAEEY